MSKDQKKGWPAFSQENFKKISHLLHMCTQIVGKLMLLQPFEPHWANLAMPLTSRGVTTGMIPFREGTFSVDLDFIAHKIIFTSTWGKMQSVKLKSMSVAKLYRKIMKALHRIGVDVKINQTPQEVSDPIPFAEDVAHRKYKKRIINTWWRIMVSTDRVLMKYHAKFFGITPKIGLFWGTLDLRDARYKGVHLNTDEPTFNFISRNSMDDEQFEVGFSASNEKYLVPSFFAFAYPKPENYEFEKIQPSYVKWVSDISEFVLDYEDLRQSSDPDNDLSLFFESSFQAFALQRNWDPELSVSGEAE
ncbi:MAG: DUF5996 family protein [Gammaproteobacteria bacterium]